MARFGARILLCYYIQPKYSKYILINSKTYYHPYECKRQETNTAYSTTTHVANIMYRSIRAIQWSMIVVEAGNNAFYYSYNDPSFDDATLHIDVWRNNMYHSIAQRQYGFVMCPVVDHLQPHVNTLNAVSLYDLYRQSVTWLLEFITR